MTNNAAPETDSVSLATSSFDRLRDKSERLLEHCSGYSQWFVNRLRRRQYIFAALTAGTVVLTTASGIIAKDATTFGWFSENSVSIFGLCSAGLAAALTWIRSSSRALIEAQQAAQAQVDRVLAWISAHQDSLDDEIEKHDKKIRSEFRTFRQTVKADLRRIAQTIDVTLSDEIARQGKGKSLEKTT